MRTAALPPNVSAMGAVDAELADPRARLAWVTGEGTVRHIGDPPADADLAEPGIADGYLLLVGRSDAEQAVA